MKRIDLIILAILVLSSCTNEERYLRYALKAAGDNRQQLEAVLDYYRNVDNDVEKLEAAKYLIANMPAHYSYADTAMVNKFYKTALDIMKSGKDAGWQRDTLLYISQYDFPGMNWRIVSDVKVMTADYLIYSIDHAFTQWRTKPWAKHLTYEEFRDWLLPYKVTELQSFDAWRDTLSAHFSDGLNNISSDDLREQTIFGALEIVRNELVNKLNPYIAWTTDAGYPLLSAETMAYMTYGSCHDYVTQATAVFRSLGLPVSIDNVPIWGRSHEGHSWYTILSDNGIEMKSPNDITIPAGMGFYPYQRFPKIYRSSYAINRNTANFQNKAAKGMDFDVCSLDVTNNSYRTTNVEIPIRKGTKLMNKNVVIATLGNVGGPYWFPIDYGYVKNGKALFKNIGRELLYVSLGFDGNNYVPISDPFIIHKDGSIEYVKYDDSSTRTVKLKRKYYESYNVVDMRRRILGAKIQCANKLDFCDAETLITIETTDIPDKMQLPKVKPHRYWRYLSPNGSYGSIAELSFFDKDSVRMQGRPISGPEAGNDAIERAFDNDWLSNFEVNIPNGNWVGMDFETKSIVSYVRIVPRSDDNDICPENKYELLYYDGLKWSSLGYQVANDNHLIFRGVPANCLLWLRNYTRGWAERPFIINDNGETIWW